MSVKFTARAIFVLALLGAAIVFFGLYWIGWAEHTYLFPQSIHGVVGFWAMGMTTCAVVGFAGFIGFLLFIGLLFGYWTIENWVEGRRQKKKWAAMGPGAD